MTTRPAHHTAKGFRNPPGSPERAAGSWRPMAAFLWRLYRKGREPVSVPDGHVLPGDQAVAGVEAALAAGGDFITWLGHAAFLIRMGGLTFLCDPWLAPWAGPRPGWGPKRFVPPGLPVDRLPPVDVLLMSHNHYDHLCEPTLKALPGKQRMAVFTPLHLGGLLRHLGFPRVTDLDWHDQVSLGDPSAPVRLTCVPAIHQSARTAFDRNRTLWCGWLIEAGGRRVWFGGDSAHGPVFAELGDRYGPLDLAIIGIGAYVPREIMRAVHTTPEEGLAMARDLKARRVLGMHWGTVVLTEEDPFEPPVRFRAAAGAHGFARDDAWLLRVGETRAL